MTFRERPPGGPAARRARRPGATTARAAAAGLWLGACVQDAGGHGPAVLAGDRDGPPGDASTDAAYPPPEVPLAPPAPMCDPSDCPDARAEERCWGEGEGCGVPLPAQAAAACPPSPACPFRGPIPGVVWPGPVLDTACGRGFGAPWCFGPCPGAPDRCPCHAGLDLDLRPGDPVYAVHDGTVLETYDSGGAGHMVAVRHDLPVAGPVTAIYWHLASGVEPGTAVAAGQRLGSLTQWSCDEQRTSLVRSHFHFAVLRGEPGETTRIAALPADGSCFGPGAPLDLLFPGDFIDPMCVLDAAPLAPDACRCGAR